MHRNETVMLSKLSRFILRHQPEKFGLDAPSAVKEVRAAIIESAKR